MSIVSNRNESDTDELLSSCEDDTCLFYMIKPVLVSK